MFEAAAKALNQLTSPAFRSVLWKSIGLAVLLLIIIGIGAHRLLSFLAGSGGAWLQQLGFAQGPVEIVLWIFAVAAGLGLAAGAIFLMPPVTALVAGFFGDEIAAEVERAHYPAEPPGAAMPVGRALLEAIRTALLALAVYLAAAPFFLFAGLGVALFFLATAFLLGREYFLLAAMRFHPPDAARALRKAHRGTVFLAGLMIAAFVSIPVLNLAAPLFGVALMVHVHKRLAGGPRPQLLAPRRPWPIRNRQ